MRPVKLTISAFGSYAGEQTLDMDLLGTSGIYLITGKTGYGKTTIFDAVCYALYGAASGELRMPGGFRSKYAQPQTETFAELIFEHDGRIYRIRRWPDQERPKKRGGGVTTQKAGVEFQLPDGRIETKAAAVSEAVTDLLGLNLFQFRNVSMIAQGEFRKFISATTEDRIRIFRDIFGTSVYERIQNSLSEDLRTVQDRLNLLNESRRQYIREITAAKSSPLMEEVENVRKMTGAGVPTQQAEDLVGRIMEEDLRSRSDVEDRIRKTDEQRRRADADLRKIADRKTWEEGKKAREQKKIQLLEEKKTEEEKKEAYEEQIPSVNKEKEHLISLRNQLPEFRTLDQLRESARQLGEQIARQEQKVKDLSEKRKESEESLKALKIEQEQLSESGAGLVKHQGMERELKARLQSVQELKECAEEVRCLHEKAKASEKSYLLARAEADELNQIYQDLNGRYLDEQAGILADRLREEPSAPCPVCGSVTHPHLAEKSDSAPDRKTVDEAKQRAGEAAEKREKASEKTGKDRARLEAALRQLESRAKELFPHASGCGQEISRYLTSQGQNIPAMTDVLYRLLKTEEEQTQNSLKQEQSALRIFEQKEKRRRELPELIRLKEEEKSRYETDLSLAKVETERMRTRKESDERRSSELTAKLIYPSGKEAQEHIRGAQAKLKAFEEEGRRITDELSRIGRAIAAAEGEIRTLDDQLKNTECPDEEEVSGRIKELSERADDLAQEKKQVDYRLTKNSEVLAHIREVSGEYDTVEKRGRMIKALHDTANGRLAGKEKMKLETYVLSFYFDRVLVKANQRFLMMTDCQYEMVRVQQAENMKSQTGLDLDVIDHYNGSRRSISSLSGGESFEAALALALGFSDAIQASLGGIRLDTMFVDEGFGSLDEDVTDRTMKALNSLASGNVLVGLISHIPGVKERVLKQIVVEKDENGTGGSRARIGIA